MSHSCQHTPVTTILLLTVKNYYPTKACILTANSRKVITLRKYYVLKDRMQCYMLHVVDSLLEKYYILHEPAATVTLYTEKMLSTRIKRTWC